MKRNFKNFNREDFLLDLLAIDWDTVIDITRQDPNSSFDAFYQSIEKLLDTHIPLTKISNKEHKRRYKPWITNGIIVSIKRRHKIFNKYVKCKNKENKAQYFTEYKILRNQINELIKDSKNEFYKHYFTENNKNLRKIWKGIKDIINIKAKSYDSPTCIIEDNKSITDPTQVSTRFNNYFSNIAETIISQRKYHGNKDYFEFLNNPFPKSINNNFPPTDENEICKIISQLNINKSSGPFSIPTKILHLIKIEISKPLADIINLSFSTGIHPEKLKIAQVIPIFKKGSKLLTSNYRPISLLSNLNMIFEKVMYDRIYNFLNNQKCFYPLQFGFRNKHSTNHALISIIDKVNEALDNKKVACGIFVDFQKAFDTVNHDILLKKLSHYGIRGSVNDWFKSYLYERKQFVSILGYNSALATVHHGVPQGSVLGPLLFLIYINDLHKAIKYSTVYHFADDTNMLRIENNYRKLEKQLNLDLKSLSTWLLANKISLNATKTELIFFKKPLSPPPPKLKIKLNGLILKPIKSIKYLGIHIDDTLSGISHCIELLPKLRRANGIMAKARYHLPFKESLSIYHATFSSILLYGCQVWGQHQNPLLNKIEKLQKNAIRIITFSEFNSHTNPLFKKLKILKFKDQITLSNCLLVHDQIHNELPNTFNNYFITTNDLYTANTKSAKAGKLFVPLVNSTRYGRHSIKHSCILAWNHMIGQLPNTDFTIIKRNDLKKLISDKFLESY